MSEKHLAILREITGAKPAYQEQKMTTEQKVEQNVDELLKEGYEQYVLRMKRVGKPPQWPFEEWVVKSMTAISIKCRHDRKTGKPDAWPIELQTNKNLGRRSEWS